MFIHLTRYLHARILKWAGALANPSSPCQCIEHFVTNMEMFLHSLTEATKDRMHSFGGLSSVAEGLDLPNEVICHSTLVSLTKEGIELLLIINVNPINLSYRVFWLSNCCLQDMHSYSRESSSGFGYHKFITVIMAEYNLGVQDALNWLGTYNDGVISRFLSNLKQIPSWDPDRQEGSNVHWWCRKMGQWNWWLVLQVRAILWRRRADSDASRGSDPRRPNFPWLGLLRKANAEETKETLVE